MVRTRDYMLLLAYFNSTLITVGAVAILVIAGAMVGLRAPAPALALEQA